MEKKKILALLKKKYPSLGDKYLESIVDKFFHIIATGIKESARIEIRNFGVFKLKNLKTREIFNPHTEKLQTIKGKVVPAFRCSKSLHKLKNTA